MLSNYYVLCVCVYIQIKVIYLKALECKPLVRVIWRVCIMYIHVRTCNGEYAEIAHTVLVDTKKASFVSYIDVAFSQLLAFP